MKYKRQIIYALIMLIAAVAIVLIIANVGGTKNGVPAEYSDQIITERISNGEVKTDASVSGLTAVSVDTISGIYVEDGSDEVLDNILTLTISNDSDTMLQYAKLILSIGDEEYLFEISSIPAGETVRAMEMNRKPLTSAEGDIVLNQEYIAWTYDNLTMCESVLNVVQRENAIIVENISGETVNAPLYVYYKNYVDGIYIGGITYRAGTMENIEPGETVVLSAKHFDPEVSQLLFVTYVP